MTEQNQQPEPAEIFAPPPPPRNRKWLGVIIAALVLLPILVVAIWTVIAMSWTQQRGVATGYVREFAQRGWLCRTWEGILQVEDIPGRTQERFAFTVRSDSVAREINRLQGQRVALRYEQHRGVPVSCVGESSYFVDGVQPAPLPSDAPPGQAVPQSPRDSTARATTPGAPRRDTIDPSAGNP